MGKLGELILRSGIPLIIAIIAITSSFVLYLPRIELRDDETTWLSQDDPVLTDYHHFEDLFGTGTFALVAYESIDPFKESEISYLSELTESLERIPHVREATSLANIKTVIGSGVSLKTKPFLTPRDAPKTEAQRSQLEAKISSYPLIDGVLISGDRGALGIVLDLEYTGLLSYEVSREITSAIQQVLAEEHKTTGRQFHIGGRAIGHGNLIEVMLNDMRILAPIVFMIAGVMLLIIFRHWACVCLPLITTLLTIVWAFGLKAMVGSPITVMSTTLVALLTIIGVANSVHFISYYNSEYGGEKNKKAAMVNTYARVGKPCFLTSLTTAVGFGSLAISSIPAVRNLGIFASFGIMSSFLLSIIIVPIGLQLAKGLKGAEYKYTKRWKSLGEYTIRNYQWLIVLGLLLSIVMGISSLNIKTEGSLLQYFKKDSTVRQSANFFDERLSGSSSTELMVIGGRGSFKDTEVLRQIERLQRTVENCPGVASSMSVVDYVKLINRISHGYGLEYSDIPGTKREIDHIFRLLMKSEDLKVEDCYIEGNHDVARISIKTRQMNQQQREELIERIEDFAHNNFQGFEWTVTGSDVSGWKLATDVVKTQVQSLGLAMLVIFGLMIALFGPRGGLASILPNILPVAFVFGLMGYAGLRLNTATTTIAAIAIGLVIDDTIHYFSHFRDNLLVTGNRERATILALQDVGPALCFTTVIIAAGFASFIFSRCAYLVDFGILSASAMVVALLGDLFVSPALLSRFNVFGCKKKNEN